MSQHYLAFFTTFTIFNMAMTLPRTNNFTEAYCWRDYVGVIPKDALVGGLDKTGKAVYIGQVLHEDKLIPGQIYQNDDKIHIEYYAKPYTKTQNAKILCTEKPYGFEWLDTKTEEVHQLALNRTLVYGGYEPNYFTYIGRAVKDGVTNVGKVICSLDSCLSLFATHNDGTVEHKVFQILAYKSKPGFDLRYNTA